MRRALHTKVIKNNEPNQRGCCSKKNQRGGRAAVRVYRPNTSLLSLFPLSRSRTPPPSPPSAPAGSGRLHHRRSPAQIRPSLLSFFPAVVMGIRHPAPPIELARGNPNPSSPPRLSLFALLRHPCSSASRESRRHRLAPAAFTLAISPEDRGSAAPGTMARSCTGSTMRGAPSNLPACVARMAEGVWRGSWASTAAMRATRCNLSSEEGMAVFGRRCSPR